MGQSTRVILDGRSDTEIYPQMYFWTDLGTIGKALRVAGFETWYQINVEPRSKHVLIKKLT